VLGRLQHGHSRCDPRSEIVAVAFPKQAIVVEDPAQPGFAKANIHNRPESFPIA
jgi:hypothetical protein